MEGRHLSRRDLSRRQQEVMDLIAKRYSNAEIAGALGISLSGAKWHVSELIAKFDVETREQLADLWQPDGWPARVRRFVLVPAVLGAAGVSLIAAVGLSIAIGIGGSSPPTGQAQASIFTSDEAFERVRSLALQEVERDIVVDNVAQPLTLDDFTLERFEFVPHSAHIELDDGDYYWEPWDGLPRDVWRARWRITDWPLNGTSSAGTFEIDVIIIDGPPTDPQLDDHTMIMLRDVVPARPGGPQARTNFSSHSFDATRTAMYPSTDPVMVAWLDGKNGGPALFLFRSNGEDLGILIQQTPGSIPRKAANGHWIADQPLSMSLTTWPEPISTEPGLISMGGGGERGAPPPNAPQTQFIARANVAKLRVQTEDGISHLFESVPAPTALGLDVRVVFTSAVSISEPLTFVAFDASGTELWRQSFEPGKGMSDPVTPKPPSTPTP